MNEGSYVLLCGGVGGSRLARGFADIIAPDSLTIVVNTADDFDHFGLRICPDLDTVTYMLSGLVDEARGWGRADETWVAMEAMARLGGETWFNLGDRDLALHLRRTELLRMGATLSEATREIGTRLDVRHRVVPMTDDPVRTVIGTADGKLTFQDYFVRHRCAPVATGIAYDGVNQATPAAWVLDALVASDLAGIVIAPSNPILSIAPILTLPGLREAIRAAGVPVVAVSPIIAGKTVKGPAAKLMAELGYQPGVGGVVDYYSDLIDGIIVDRQDEGVYTASDGVQATFADTMMGDLAARRRVAESCLKALETLRHD
jgi:LPPG:FO 2-phospho-L-lactate transferase